MLRNPHISTHNIESFILNDEIFIIHFSAVLGPPDVRGLFG